MAVYRPDDPLGWAAIAAEQADQAAGPNADGSTRYTLPDMGLDPSYIAYLTQYQANKQNLGADRELRQQRAKSDYEQALRDLEQQGLSSAYDTDTSLLSRGMYASGERTRRQGDLTNVLAEGRSRADTTLANAAGQTDADYERALSQLNTEREAQIVASKARIAEAQRAGAAEAGLLGGGTGTGSVAGSGGGTTGGGGSSPSVTTPKPQTPSQQQSAANQQAAVAYQQQYNNPGGGRGAYGPVNAKPIAKPLPKPTKPQLSTYKQMRY